MVSYIIMIGWVEVGIIKTWFEWSHKRTYELKCWKKNVKNLWNGCCWPSNVSQNREEEKTVARVISALYASMWKNNTGTRTISGLQVKTGLTTPIFQERTKQVYNLFQDLWNRLIILRGGEWMQSQLCAKSFTAKTLQTDKHTREKFRILREHLSLSCYI